MFDWPLNAKSGPMAGDGEGVQRAIGVARVGTDSDDFTFHRLFLHRVGNEDAAGTFRLRHDAVKHDAVL